MAMTRRTFGQIAAGVAAGLVAGVTPFLMRLWRAPRMWTIGPGDGWPTDFRDGDSITILKGAEVLIPPEARVKTALVSGQLQTVSRYSGSITGTIDELIVKPGCQLGRVAIRQGPYSKPMREGYTLWRLGA